MTGSDWRKRSPYSISSSARGSAATSLERFVYYTCNALGRRRNRSATPVSIIILVSTDCETAINTRNDRHEP
jgi:hypothetical protein